MEIDRQDFLRICGIAAAGGLIALGGRLYQLNETRKPVVDKVTIPIRGLHPALEGFTIVQLTDIHLWPYTQTGLVRQAVAMANSLQPDLILLTGDYVWRIRDAAAELAPILAGLDARYGIYSVMGNHDYWLDIRAVQDAFDASHLRVLYNEGIPLGVGKAVLYLAGMDDGWSGRPDLNASLQEAPSGAPVVLLLHEPDLIDETSRDPRVSLQLSGHTHGGQVLIRGKAPFFTPYLGKKYHQGLFKVRDAWLYTNRGLGVISVPLRINCPPEVTHLTLVP